MKRFTDLINETLPKIREIFPWDLDESLIQESSPLLLDIREPYEFEQIHIQGSFNVPRGILETACEYGYEETVPELAAARERSIVIICRSGNRSVLAAHTMLLLGFADAVSLKTGVRGWNDYELPLYDVHGEQVVIDDADRMLAPIIRPEQQGPVHPH